MSERKEALVSSLVRIPIDDGEWVLVEGDASGGQGPIQAGRAGDLVTQATQSLQEAIRPVVRASRIALQELRETAPDEVDVEFGVALTAESGAVIAKAGGGCHLTVKLIWKGPADGLAE